MPTDTDSVADAADAADGAATTAQLVHDQLSRYDRRLSSLELFLTINWTAVEKICKKFDKKLKMCYAAAAPVTSTIVGPAQCLQQQCTQLLSDCRNTLLRAQTNYPATAMPAPTSELIDLDELDKEEQQVTTVQELDFSALPVAHVSRLSLALAFNGFGERICVPVLVAKGRFDGPVVGITSAIHGNELNGIPTIFRVFRELDVQQMRGTLVAVPVLNPPGFDRHQRYFSDGQDLNRLFPGRASGNCGAQFVHAIDQKILSKFQYCIDLHTASFGRVNSLYVRCDMTNAVVKKMALLQNPQIIVHNSSPGGSLRGSCQARGIPCVTVEIGNPSVYQHMMQARAFSGIENILSHLNVNDDIVDVPDVDPVICNSSHWLFSQAGGILEIRPKLCEWVRKGDVIAQIRNVFGDVTNLFRADTDGVVIGKNADPVCQSGDRLVHIGVVDSSVFAKNVQDGH